MPAGYKAFQWTNMAVYNPAGTTASGYINGMVSSSNVGVAMVAPTTEMSAPDFFFTPVSMQIAGSWRNGVSVTFTGSVGGSVVNSQTVIVNSNAPTAVSFGVGWEGLDKLTIEASGGVKVASYTDDGLNVVVDDMMVA